MAHGGGRRARLALISLNAIEHDFAQNGGRAAPIGPAEAKHILDVVSMLIQKKPARARLSPG